MMAYEFVALAVFSFLIGYGVKMWQDQVSEWRCEFCHIYNFFGGGWHRARCELSAGHAGPHRVRVPGKAPDHFKNELDR